MIMYAPTRLSFLVPTLFLHPGFLLSMDTQTNITVRTHLPFLLILVRDFYNQRFVQPLSPTTTLKNKHHQLSCMAPYQQVNRHYRIPAPSSCHGTLLFTSMSTTWANQALSQLSSTAHRIKLRTGLFVAKTTTPIGSTKSAGYNRQDEG